MIKREKIYFLSEKMGTPKQDQLEKVQIPDFKHFFTEKFRQKNLCHL